MKTIISILLFASSISLTIFFTIPQYNCVIEKCSYDGIKALRVKKASYSSALESARDLESRRSDLTNKYNLISVEDKQKLENLLPNNVDNIKLVLELETIAKRYGLIVESPKLDTTILDTSSDGQAIRKDNNANLSANAPYGTFTLDFTVRSTYSNAKLLISDIEKNLRLIEPTYISIKVPGIEDGYVDSSKKVYPEGTYDINIKAVIYYLKN